MDSLAAQVMHNQLFARIYQRAWRPVFTRLFSLGGTATTDFDDALRAYLTRPGPRLVLDVACGPGNLTGPIGAGLSGSGRVIGLDHSASMLATAVATNATARTQYVRGDAHALPFPENTFDEAICLAALYLVPDPLPVLDEMVRVLHPGGQIVVFTSATGPITSLPGVRTVASLAGYRVFDHDEITDRLRAAGAVGIEQTVIGEGQYVLAVKP